MGENSLTTSTYSVASKIAIPVCIGLSLVAGVRYLSKKLSDDWKSINTSFSLFNKVSFSLDAISKA